MSDSDALSIDDAHSRSEIANHLDMRLEWLQSLVLAASVDADAAPGLCDLSVHMVLQCQRLAERWSALDVEIRKVEAAKRMADEQTGHDALTFGDQSRL